MPFPAQVLTGPTDATESGRANGSQAGAEW